ncbi:CPCC family cysteine-rich protein [Oceanirhabdus sp. W0125-5]|uniref:CPCC family cysteine-rich protein n=1 Tax=Oceanirhabdus sp. W0125-5 TaxID=2999116 RepID=UPI0022F3469A|nr:CPCC family cysteine-rich protein [Oceanirhabdus sp. W0125-5]WBW96674.1 CPCC family cysteine-rich protein [Oceanirhabdus sp. W0125-5]
MSEKKYVCPCCGYLTLEEPTGSYDICPICFWEDEGMYDDPDEISGANGVSLRVAQQNFKEFNACAKKCLQYVRKPTEDDVYKGPLDISEIKKK